LDDTLDVVGVHGVGGAWGMIATGLFAAVAVNAAGANGLFHGNPGQLGAQAAAVAVTLGYSLVMTLVILRVLDAVIGLRVSEEEERMGLDLSQHGERAYALEGLSVLKVADLTVAQQPSTTYNGRGPGTKGAGKKQSPKGTRPRGR
jgi:ammonia channel protein AmtB